jgi:hypothetical protein
MVRFGKWQIDFHRPGSGDPEINIDQSKNLLEVERGNDLLASLCIAYAFDKALSQPLVTIIGYQEKEHLDDDDSMEDEEYYDQDEFPALPAPEGPDLPALPYEENKFVPDGYLEQEKKVPYGYLEDETRSGNLDEETKRDDNQIDGYPGYDDIDDIDEYAEGDRFDDSDGYLEDGE